MIEVSEYTFDTDTGMERFIGGRALGKDDHSIQFNTRSVTGADEVITVTRVGQVLRGNGEEAMLLDDPSERRILNPDDNRLRVREVFISGPSGRIMCIRRLPWSYHWGREEM